MVLSERLLNREGLLFLQTLLPLFSPKMWFNGWNSCNHRGPQDDLENGSHSQQSEKMEASWVSALQMNYISPGLYIHILVRKKHSQLYILCFSYVQPKLSESTTYYLPGIRLETIPSNLPHPQYPHTCNVCVCIWAMPGIMKQRDHINHKHLS